MDSSHDERGPTTEVLPGGKPEPLRLRLLVLTGASAGRQIELPGGRYLVGTERTCDLVLEDRAVSRAHLEVGVLPGGARFTDLGSTNGSFLGESRFQEIEGGPGTVVRLGKTELKLALAESTFALPPSARERFGKLRGRSLAMRRVFAVLERVAPSDVAVLIEGETGTGKDLCAQALHSEGRRAKGPFVVVDLAGIQPNLIESELFGHVRGAFTGAAGDRAGAFERAEGGTLFLDEITALAPDLQPRLLRALENRQTKRVGANEYRTFDVRVVAAANQDLQAEVKAKRFRGDLYHRLAVVSVELPPLRERLEDLPLLVAAMLESMNASAKLGQATLAALQSYGWPGNVRELRNVVERALSLGGGLTEVPGELLPGRSASPRGNLSVQADLPFKEAKERLVAAFERDYLETLLLRCDHNVSKAAREAGIDRVHLHRLLKKHGLG